MIGINGKTRYLSKSTSYCLYMMTETTQFSSETLACLMQLMKALPPHERFAKRPPACHRLLSMNFTIFDHKKYSFYF